MEAFLVGLVLLMCAGVGWSIGANDAANSLGTAVGSRVLTLRQAIVLICVFGFLGATLEGFHVVKTVGNGIVPLSDLDKDLALYITLVSCFSACAWVVLATRWKMPISTSHSIVGAVAGAGFVAGAPVEWKMLGDIFVCWILTPLGAAVLGYIFCWVFKGIFYGFVPRRYVRPVLSGLIVIGGCYVAYTWGANDVANAVGVIAGAGILTVNASLALGGVAILLGIVTWGYKVIETIGFGITQLLPVMAFSAQLASAVNVHIYTVCGIPVSTSHSIVGAIFGVGLVRGVRVINLRIIREIIFCWLATPFISGILSVIVLKGILHFVKR